MNDWKTTIWNLRLKIHYLESNIQKPIFWWLSLYLSAPPPFGKSNFLHRKLKYTLPVENPRSSRWLRIRKMWFLNTLTALVSLFWILILESSKKRIATWTLGLGSLKYTGNVVVWVAKFIFKVIPALTFTSKGRHGRLKLERFRYVNFILWMSVSYIKNKIFPATDIVDTLGEFEMDCFPPPG